MLTVIYNNDSGINKLEMKGHCATAPKGYDLVCAAASILCLTMAQVLKNNADKLKKEPDISINEGYSTMIWECNDKYNGALNNCLYTVITGLEVLQHNHPDCISFKKEG